MTHPASDNSGTKKQKRTPKILDGTRQLRIVAAAYLSAELHKNQKEITEIIEKTFEMPCKPSTISRDLDFAIKEGWLLQGLSSAIPQGTLLQAQTRFHSLQGNRDLEAKLATLSQGTLKRLRVFHTFSPANEWSIRLKQFSKEAAPAVLDLLGTGKHVGLTFGVTIRSLIGEIETYNSTRPWIRPQGPSIIPTSGEPLGRDSGGCSSTALSERLSLLFGGKCHSSLRGVPPVIPHTHQEGPDRDAIWKYIRGLASYTDIFGSNEGRQSKIKCLDTILTSCGSLEQGWDVYQNIELISVGGVNREEIKRLAIGDIGGVLIPRRELGKPERKRFEEYQSLWTGISLCDFEKIAQKTPGVILCAIDNDKRDIVLELCRLRLVNQLFIDHTLAESIAQSLKGQ